MTPNTELSDEQILEVAGEWFVTGENQCRHGEYFYRSLGAPTNVCEGDLVKFARAILSAVSRSEGGEPVAYLVEGSHDGKLYAKIVHFTVDEARNSASEFARHYSTVSTAPLYASPLPQEGAAGSGFDQMRAEFTAWVKDRGCDTDGAWSAWQGCWNLLRPAAGSGSGGVKGPVVGSTGADWREVAEVVSFTNGSYSRNYKVRWIRDVPEGTKLYAKSSPTSPPNGKTADGVPACPTCRGEGEVDERIGGDPFAANVATCPDCNGTGNAAVDASRGGEHG